MTTTQKTTDVTAPPPTQPLVVDGAGMSGNGVTERSCQLRHCQTERTGDCRLQHETDRGCVFLTAPVRNNCQKHSQKPFQRVLTRHWKPACRRGSRNTTRSFWCRLLWYRGAPDITREIQQDIARRMRAEP